MRGGKGVRGGRDGRGRRGGERETKREKKEKKEKREKCGMRWTHGVFLSRCARHVSSDSESTFSLACQWKGPTLASLF